MLGWLLLLAMAVETNGMRVLETQVYAPNETPIKPIHIRVTVLNETKEAIERPTVKLTLRPSMKLVGPRGYPPGGRDTDPREPTVFDPQVMEKEIEVLYPGRERTVSFTTPYLSANGFRSNRKFFTVENLIPNLRRSVVIHYDVEVNR